MIRIIDAKFLSSSPDVASSLPEGVSEVAFLGRSNVGKSSMINALTKRKNLAKSSSTPGKTRLINFFEITFANEDLRYQARLVDLPGFGYAKVSKSMKKEWQENLTAFIQQRDSIRVFVHLLDSRHPALEIDKEVGEYLDQIKRPDQQIVTLFTKSDKLKQKDIAALKKVYPGALMASSTKGNGIQKATDIIFDGLFGL